MTLLLKLLPWALVALAAGGGGIGMSCQATDKAELRGERDVARQETATVRAELASCRRAFGLEQRELLVAVGAAQTCAVEYAAMVERKDRAIAEKAAAANRDAVLLKRCGIKIPEILIERGSAMWPAR